MAKSRSETGRSYKQQERPNKSQEEEVVRDLDWDIGGVNSNICSGEALCLVKKKKNIDAIATHSTRKKNKRKKSAIVCFPCG